ncbi:MAG: hypothetical protein ACK5JS_08405 [Mangrovibacterium sp.]
MKLNYEKSGVKTLRTTSSIFLTGSIVISIVLFCISLNTGYLDYDVDWNGITTAIVILLTGFFVFGLGYAIAKISEVALLKEHLAYTKINEKNENENI